MSPIIKIVIFSVVSFSLLFVFSKLEGKKQIAQMSFIDYTIAISIGSIAAQFAVNTTEPWYHYVIAMTIFFVLDILIIFLSRKGKFMKNLLRGRPILLIENGLIHYSNLKKSKLDVNDLLALLRQNGFFQIQDVAYAYFETDGELSVLPVGAQKPVVVSDVNAQITTAKPCKNLVIDGAVMEDELNYLNRDKSWLLTRLGNPGAEKLKNVLLAVYDETADAISVYYKRNDI